MLFFLFQVCKHLFVVMYERLIWWREARESLKRKRNGKSWERKTEGENRLFKLAFEQANRTVLVLISRYRLFRRRCLFTAAAAKKQKQVNKLINQPEISVQHICTYIIVYVYTLTANIWAINSSFVNQTLFIDVHVLRSEMLMVHWRLFLKAFRWHCCFIFESTHNLMCPMNICVDHFNWSHPMYSSLSKYKKS